MTGPWTPPPPPRPGKPSRTPVADRLVVALRIGTPDDVAWAHTIPAGRVCLALIELGALLATYGMAWVWPLSTRTGRRELFRSALTT